jgi:hypothetical protein
MAQQTQEKRNFEFAAGTGAIRAKIGAQQTTIVYGRMAVPGFGQVFVDGLAPAGSKVLVCDVTKLSGTQRVKVGTLELPAGDQDVRQGKFVEQPAEGKKKSKVWTVTGTMRQGATGWHMAIRLPEVKISGSRTFGAPSSN